jgi:hypothetical protein
LVFRRFPDDETYGSHVVVLGVAEAGTIDPNNFFVILEDLIITPRLLVGLESFDFSSLLVLELDLRDPILVASSSYLFNTAEVNIHAFNILLALNFGEEEWGHLAVGQNKLNTSHHSVDLI